MNRLEFMQQLELLLSDIPENERKEAITFYNDYLNDAGVENEQEIIEAMGTPEVVAAIIKEGLSEDSDTGEFTEQGYKGMTEEQKKNEVIKANIPHYSRGEKYTAYKNPYENLNYTSQQEQSGYKNAYENYNGNTYTTGNKSTSYQEKSSSEKSGLSTGAIVAIVIACIIFSPVILGLAGGGVGILVGGLGAIVGILAGFFAGALACLIGGPVLLVVGIILLWSVPFAGILLIGIGLLTLGIGLALLWICVWMVGTAAPAIIRGIVNLFRKIFHKGGEGA